MTRVDALELAGLAALVAAAFLVAVPLGVAALGLALLIAALAAGKA